MQKIKCLSSFVAALFLNSCAYTVPNIEACSGISGVPGVGALCQNSNIDDRRRLTVEEWLEFLYAKPERPDPKNPGKTLPEKGPAICLSSIDYTKNETSIAELCVKIKCTYEQKKALERMKIFKADMKTGKPVLPKK